MIRSTGIFEFSQRFCDFFRNFFVFRIRASITISSVDQAISCQQSKNLEGQTELFLWSWPHHSCPQGQVSDCAPWSTFSDCVIAFEMADLRREVCKRLTPYDCAISQLRRWSTGRPGAPRINGVAGRSTSEIAHSP